MNREKEKREREKREKDKKWNKFNILFDIKQKREIEKGNF